MRNISTMLRKFSALITLLAIMGQFLVFSPTVHADSSGWKGEYYQSNIVSTPDFNSINLKGIRNDSTISFPWN